MKALAWVAVGGALGAVARYAVSGAVTRAVPGGGFPWGTFVVNVSGCLLIGVAVALVERLSSYGLPVRLFLVTGILGGFTTFSAFGVETLFLLKRGQTAIALAYAFGSLAAGVAAVALGLALGAPARPPGP
jgi:CrcB protein